MIGAHRRVYYALHVCTQVNCEIFNQIFQQSQGWTVCDPGSGAFRSPGAIKWRVTKIGVS